jgi:hypothetical protein
MFKSEANVIRDIILPRPGRRSQSSVDINNEDEIDLEEASEAVKLSPRLIQLLRMGLADKGELELMKRALKSDPEKVLNTPILRKKLVELLNKLIAAVEDDNQIWLRMRKRLTSKDTRGEEE